MAKPKFVSIRPSRMSKGGGKFNIPPGLECTISDETTWTTWEEAGETALKGNREADDPALKLVVEIDGRDDMTEFLSAGKADKFRPTKDGNNLELVDDTAEFNDGSNAGFFITSLCDKKLHGKLTLDEEALDEGISAIHGLVFISGRKILERDFQDGAQRGKPRPNLFAEQIVKLPGGGKTSSSKTKPAKDEDDENKDEKSAKATKEKGGDDVESKAEKALVEVLDNPKYRKGIARGRAYTQVFNLVKDEEDHREIVALIEDEDWVTSADRPWEYDEKEGLLVKA